VQSSDVAITMACGNACPALPGKRYPNWQLADPADQGVEAARTIRDAIEQRARGLPAELSIPASA
jgi:arsenate reductase